jgi:UDP:flavonoid glycosyltransferase YjiC (YdhE family)
MLLGLTQANSRPYRQLATDERHRQPSHRLRRKVLFVAEAVTLAHVARPAALARTLNPLHDEVVIASHSRTWAMLEGIGARLVALNSIPGKLFTAALAAGKPVYDTATLRAYVEEDLRLLASEQPEVVIGDFRLSLAISARLAGIPYAAICNAHWSPWAPRHAMPCPVVPASRLPVIGAISRLFGPLVVPLVMRAHARALNTVGREYGMEPPAHGLRGTYTDADIVLYADAPGFAELGDLPANHHCIGVPLWSPPVPAPTWLERMEQAGQHWIYVTLGSSGDASLLPRVINGLRGCGLPIVIATAGAVLPTELDGLVLAEPYLPGERLAAGAALVVCNGGNTAQQALAGGAPVLAIASNLDQFLHMGVVERRGCGRTLRADTVTAGQIADIACELMRDPKVAQAVVAAQQCIRDTPVGPAFAYALAQLGWRNHKPLTCLTRCSAG